MKRLGMVVVGWLLAMGLAFAQVNINTAKKEQLDGLKGIGPTKAQAIVDYRKKNGPFKSVDDLQNVPGIGPATLKDLRSDVTVSGVSRPVVAAPAASKTEPLAKKTEVAAPALPKVAAPAHPAPTAPVSAAESKPVAPAAPAMPAKPAMSSIAAPAKPVMPAAPAAPGKIPAESKAAASAAQATPARPAQPAQPARPAAN